MALLWPVLARFSDSYAKFARWYAEHPSGISLTTMSYMAVPVYSIVYGLMIGLLAWAASYILKLSRST